MPRRFRTLEERLEALEARVRRMGRPSSSLVAVPRVLFTAGRPSVTAVGTLVSVAVTHQRSVTFTAGHAVGHGGGDVGGRCRHYSPTKRDLYGRGPIC